MKKIIFFFILFSFTRGFGQTSQNNKNIRQYLNRYYADQHIKNEKISIDTIIKLRNGNYFVLVIKEKNGVSNAESGTYDCMEIHQDNKYFEIVNSVAGLGDNTGGMGMVHLTYQLVYLNKKDYLLIANKHFIHHGNYNLLTFIVNSEKKYLDLLVTDDYSGITEDSSSNLKQIATINISKGIFRKLTFKFEKCEISADNAGYDIITEKIYEIKANDFDSDLGCVTGIKLLSLKKKKIQ